MTVEELLDKYRNAKRNIPALVKLYEVDWSSLTHAHGEASDFPILINAALSDDENDREFALKLLHETIWHQGTIYQATAFAVPLIAELIKSPDITNHADFANLLAAIAQGSGAFEEGFSNEKDEKEWREIFAREEIDLNDVISESKKWAKATRDSVRKHLYLLYPYLNYPDGFNTWIASALACYPQLGHETIPLIEKAIEAEKDEK
jgi:hypothetical protein